jgi:predicted transcriptional regulator of viral defense system
LDDYEILYFKIRGLAQQLPNSLSNTNELVENLYQKGLINRIERGVYAKSNYTNINVLATFISQNSAIGYWSALHYHGLTERFPNTLFVKTTQRKRNTTILGTQVKYVTVKSKKNRGVFQEGYGDNSFAITDVEMTLIDCFDQPRYAGDFADLIKAFANAKLTNNRLIDYTKAYHNITMVKRLGYLATLFQPEKLRTFIEYAQSKVNKRYSLMDAGGFDEGEFNSQWKLRLNVSEDDLLKIAESRY